MFLAIILAGCVSKQKEDASIAVAKLWGAQKYSVTNIHSADTDKGKSKTIVLKLEDLKGVDDKYPHENITSLSAYTFLTALPSEEYNGFDFMKVEIKNNAQFFEKKYKISDIVIAKNLFSVVNVFSNKIISNEWEDLDELFDKTIISDTLLFEIKEVIKQINITKGKQDKTTVVFFDFTHTLKTKEPIMITQFEMSNDYTETLYEMMIRVSDKKIISLVIY
jgi:hypothetical protein